MPKPLRISPIALDSTNRKVLKVAVGLINDEGIASLLLPDNSPHGHLLVIDADNPTGQQALQEASEGQVKLVLSEERLEGKNLIWQQPPVRVTDMQELLTRICLRMKASFASQEASTQAMEEQAANAAGENDSESTANGSDTPPASVPDEHVSEAPARREAPQGGPSRTLFLTLLKAKQEQACYRIGLDRHRLLVGGHNGTVASRTDEDVKSIMEAPFKQLQVEQTDIIAFAKEAQDMNISPLDGLLWQTGVEYSDGQLLAGHDMRQPIRLKAWPNFTRNGFRQSHFKLAAIMARQPISLKELRQQAGVPQGEIVSFYNAAYAVGLIDRSATAGSDPQASRPRTRRKGLLGMLARKLGFR